MSILIIFRNVFYVLYTDVQIDISVKCSLLLLWVFHRSLDKNIERSKPIWIWTNNTSVSILIIIRRVFTMYWCISITISIYFKRNFLRIFVWSFEKNLRKNRQSTGNATTPIFFRKVYTALCCTYSLYMNRLFDINSSKFFINFDLKN